jgi:hypothetical protein
MNETLIYTDTRPRARSTGHAFGFEGNLGMPVIISGMLSVFLLTMLLNGDIGMPLFAKFLLASLPISLIIGYIVALRSRKPPRFDLDLFASWVNGRSFQSVRIQPRHRPNFTTHLENLKKLYRDVGETRTYRATARLKDVTPLVPTASK